jgi:hypothetical protein
MKRYNLLLSILLSITTVFLIISLFLFNGRFIKKVLFKHNIVDVVYKNIDNEIDEEFSLDKDLLEIDIIRYIDNGYFLNVKGKIISNGENKYEDIYSKNIKLFNEYNIFKLKSVFYILTFIFIIVTGVLFILTKRKHNIDYILLISGIIDIIIYGVIFIFNNFNSSELIIVNTLLHILLAIGVLFLVSSLVLINEDKIRKVFNCK